MEIDGVDKSGCAQWQIERVELVFYNPRHRRWQYFVEDPYGNIGVAADGESLHRRQIRSLLKTLHDILDGLVKKSESSISIRPRPASNSKPPAPIPINKPDDVDNEYWRLYLDYLSATALPEGLSLADLGQLAEFTRSYQDGKQPKTEIAHNVALAVLSLLPILEGWDTWGCILRTHKAKLEGTSASFPPAKLRDLRHVCYLFDLDYSPSQDCGIDLTSSEHIVGDKNKIAIQGAVCGWQSMDLTFAVAETRADFFARGYCANPLDSIALYRCYGALIDPILKHLYGGLPTRQFVIAFPVAAGGRTHFFQIAFSTTCDEPNLKSLWDSWMPVHNVIWTPEMRFFLREQLHRIQILAFQTEIKKSLTDKFLLRDSVTREEFQQESRNALLGSIYHLFPAVSMEFDNRSYGYYPYTYRLGAGIVGLPVGFEWRLPQNKLDRTADISIPSRRESWEISPWDQLTIRVIAPYEFVATDDETSEADDATRAARREPAKQIANHEARELLDEQNDFLTVFEKYLPEEKRWRKEDDERCARLVAAWASNLTIVQRGDILSSLNSRDWKRYLEELLKSDIQVHSTDPPRELRHWQFRFTPNSLDRYITQGSHIPGDGMTLEAKRLALMQLLRPSLLLQVSEYFEAGPVIPLTHSKAESEIDKVIEGGLNGAKRAVDEYGLLHKRICERVAALKKHNGDDWLIKGEGDGDLESFHRFFGGTFQKARSPEYLKNDEAARLRNSLRVDKLFVAGCENPMPTGYYFYGVCPSALLSRFSRRYIEEFDRESEWDDCTIRGCSQYIPDPTEIVYYREPYHTRRQGKLILVHHFIVLPYRIRNRHDAQLNSDLLEIWNATGKEIGELFYREQENVYQFLPNSREVVSNDRKEARGRFVLTDSLDGLTARIACKKCPKLILRFDHWTQEKVG